MSGEVGGSSVMTASSNSAASGDASVSSSGQKHLQHQEEKQQEQEQEQQKPMLVISAKKKRNLPGTPDPDAEVVALSPRTLLATNRFVCEVCGKGFQRDQNLQLHRRGHNLPWKLRRTGGDGAGGGQQVRRKRVYVCPEETCVHHHPSRALGDLTGIKKHFCRKHGEKKWRCDRCSKKYAVMSDWKAHCKTCGSREYRCDCGTVFSRRDSFITHRAFCDVLAEETAKAPSAAVPSTAGSATTEDADPKASASLAAAVSVSSPPRPASPLRSPSQEPPLSRPQPLPAENRELDATTENTATIQQCTAPPASQLAKVGSSVNDLHQREGSGACSSNMTVTCGGDILVGLFAPAPMPDADQKPQMFAGLTPADSPSVGLSAAAGLSLFASPPPQQPPTPHMSATALLQKAAQMGAAATSASLLRGFCLAPSSTAPSSSLVPDPAGFSASLGLGLLPSPQGCAGGFAELVMGGAGSQSSFCGSRPSTTLDFLGLGMTGAGAGSTGGGLSALFNSITGAGLELTPAASGPFGSDVQDRKPPTGLI